MQTWWSSALLVGLGAVLTYVSSAAQFRHQQKVERARWLRDQRLAAYRTVADTLRHSSDFDHDLSEAARGAAASWPSMVRRDAPTSYGAAIAGVQLVGSFEVLHYVEKLEASLSTPLDYDEPPTAAEIRAMIDSLQGLEVAMREDVQDPVSS